MWLRVGYMTEKHCNEQRFFFAPVEVNLDLLTFDHDHVDIDGADDGLGKPFSSLQEFWDFSGWDHVVGFGTKRHQLPDGHT